MFGTGLGVFFPIGMYLVSLLGSLLALVRPRIGVYIAVFIMPLQAGRFRLHQYPLGALVLKMLLFCTLLGVIFGRESIIPPRRMRWVIIGLCVITYFSLWVGAFIGPNVPLPFNMDNPDGSHTPFNYWVNFMHLPLLYVLVCATIKEKRHMQILLLLMIVPFLWSIKNLWGNVSHRDTTEYFEHLRYGMGMDFGGSNGAAAFIAQCTLFMLGIYGIFKKVYVRALVIALIALGVFGVLYSYSRGAYLAFAVGLVYLAIFRVRWYLLVGVLIAPLLPFVLPRSVIQRVTMTYQEGELDDSSEGRLEIWEHALKTTLKSPLAGVGFDTYRYYRQGEELLDTHNMYLKALVETGPIGLGLLVGLFVLAFREAHRLSRLASDPFLRAVGAGFAAYMVAVMAGNMFGDRWLYIDLSGYTWALMGMVVLGMRWTSEATPEPTPPVALENATP